MLSLDRQNEWREAYRRTHPGWRPATEIFADRVRQRLGLRSRLLDLGCGRGGLVEQLDHPPHLVTGIDPDFDSVRTHRLPALSRLAGHSDSLPFAPGSFDVIYAAWLLEHLAAPAATFGQVARALRQGGLFIFITPNARHPLAWANRWAGRLGQAQGRLVSGLYGRAAGDTFPTAYRANTPAVLRQLTESAGLILDELTLIADPSYVAFNRIAFQIASALDDRLPESRRIHIIGLARKPLGTSG
jgi:SAM-dependent methyltransferase